MAQADLIIRISGDVKKYEEALEEANKKTENFSDALSAVAKASAVVFAALTAEIGLATKAYAESEEIQNRLTQAIKNQGLESTKLSAAYKKQADELQDLTGVDNDVIASGQAMLQNFVGQREISGELTTAIVDLGAATGNIEGAFDIVGRAIQGNVRGLKQYGIEIDATQDKQARMDEIITKLTQKFGGQAQAQTQGLGSLKLLKAAFDDVQKALGEQFAPLIEKATRFLTGMFKAITEDKALVSMIASLIAGGAALAGFVTFVASASVAIIGLSSVAAALGVSLAALLGPLGLIAAAVTLVGIAIGKNLTENVKTDQVTKLTEKLAELQKEAEKTDNQIKIFAGTGRNFDSLSAKAERLKGEIEKIETALERANLQSLKTQGSDTGVDPKAKALADQAAAEEARRDQARIASKKAANEALYLEANNGSAQLIALKEQESQLFAKIEEETNVQNRAALQQKIDENALLQEQAYETQFEQRAAFQQELLTQNEEYQALDDEQKAQFLAKNQQALQNQFDTENQARQKAALDRANIQVKEHNDFLANQTKFGTAYALINQIMNSAIVQGAGKAFGELAALQSSSNSTLKGIGKAAATAQIIIKTAESAINIYSGFSTIPIIGPALGVAGAAAAVAFGAEQIGKVNSAAEGGLLEGGIPGIDSIPVLAQQGELVVPRQNFDEVVDSVAARRGGEGVTGEQAGAGQGGGGIAVVQLELKNGLMDLIEAYLVERQNLGISIVGSR